VTTDWLGLIYLLMMLGLIGTMIVPAAKDSEEKKRLEEKRG
jgi:hypothetical protein